MAQPIISLATRSSALALLQADLVMAALTERFADLATSRLLVQSAGDLRLDVPIHAIGGRGVFVKEVDQAVLDGQADAAVHSAKDLPSGRTDGLVIGACLPRADPRDALVGLGLDELATGARVATGSVRRRAQLAWLRPDLTFEDLRGNIAKRLEKIPSGGAVVVAFAALERLGLSDRAAHVFSVAEMLPQVGQGVVAVTCRADDRETLALLGAIDDAATRRAVEAERAWLAAVGGGCDLPVGAYGRVLEGASAATAELHLEAMIASLDGHVVVRSEKMGSDPAALGGALAVDLLERCGGRSLLEAGESGLA